MGVFNSKKLEEAKKIIRSHTAEDLQAWIDMDNARMALADREDDLLQQPAKPRVAAKINGATRSAAPAKGVTIKKTRAKKVMA